MKNTYMYDVIQSDFGRAKKKGSRRDIIVVKLEVGVFAGVILFYFFRALLGV